MLWARCEIKTLGDIVNNGRLLCFDDLKRGRNLPNRMLFRYLQLRHAFQAQFPRSLKLEANDVESLLRTSEMGGILSALYSILARLDTSKVSQLFSVWQSDILTLADSNWEEGIQQYIPLMVSTRDRLTQLKFIHRMYYSPDRLAKIYPDRRPTCHRCNAEVGTFFHVVWSCPQLRPFWTGVVEVINSIGRLRVPYDPIPLLLGICDTLEAPQSKKLFVFYAAFYARKAILMQWNRPLPPYGPTVAVPD